MPAGFNHFTPLHMQVNRLPRSPLAEQPNVQPQAWFGDVRARQRVWPEPQHGDHPEPKYRRDTQEHSPQVPR